MNIIITLLCMNKLIVKPILIAITMSDDLGHDDYFVNRTKDSLSVWVHNSASYTGDGASIGNEIFAYVTLITAVLLLFHR